MTSLKDELAFFFSGQGMPYARVSIVVAVVVSVLFMVFFPNNYIKDGGVAVVDLDNSNFSREFVEEMDASPYISVSDVLNVPADPDKLLYNDRNIAVVYLPKGFEKNRYNISVNSIGVFYDNTNAAQTGNIKSALNTIVAIENQKIGAPQVQSLGLSAEQASAVMNNISIRERVLFNPLSSHVNSSTLGFLIFFASMFFVFATIGIVARLRVEGKWEKLLVSGNPFDLMVRLVPYCMYLIVSIIIGLCLLRLMGDLTFSGNFFTLLLALVLLSISVGLVCFIFGWSAAHPGLAGNRMILFVPAGFIMGGQSGPFDILPQWAHYFCHVFPLVWEFRLVRDIIVRGASFMESARLFGGYMTYTGVLAVIVCLCFYHDRSRVLKTNRAVPGSEVMAEQ